MEIVIYIYPEYVLLLVLIHLKCMSKELILLNYSKKIFSNYNPACLEDECMLM
jgi:hypothetical protein